MIMGYTDDALIRVTGDDAHAFIDVRSVSRYGMHDLGANAGHIRELFAEVKSALEKGEKTGLEQAGVKGAKPGQVRHEPVVDFPVAPGAHPFLKVVPVRFVAA